MAQSGPPRRQSVHFFLLWGFLEYKTSLAGDPVTFDQETKEITGVNGLPTEVVKILWSFIHGLEENGMVQAALTFNGVPQPVEIWIRIYNAEQDDCHSRPDLQQVRDEIRLFESRYNDKDVDKIEAFERIVDISRYWISGIPINQTSETLVEEPISSTFLLAEKLSTLGKYSHMDDSLRSSIVGMENRAVTMLSAPSGINGFYRLLLLTQGSPKVRNTLNNIDKDIIRQVESTLPRLPIMDPNWAPPCPDSNMAPKDIAITMDEALFYPFRLIPFSVFRDAPYGNHLEQIADVVDGIKHIYAELRQLFMKHPEQRAIYSEAKELMQFPVSIRVLSDSLSDQAVPSGPSDTLHFIFQPIHEVFRNPRLAHAAKLRRLGALELEYTKMVEHMCHSGCWNPFGSPPNIDRLSNLRMSWEILKARRWFSEQAGDFIGNIKYWGPGELTVLRWHMKRVVQIVATQRKERMSKQGRWVDGRSIRGG